VRLGRLEAYIQLTYKHLCCSDAIYSEKTHLRLSLELSGETLHDRSGVVTKGFLDSILSYAVLQRFVPLD